MGDPAGASTHYAADVGDVRWPFLDNSCWSLTGCDGLQRTSDGSTTPQLAWLREQAGEATAAGTLVFVVMHMPTQDPRDQSYTDSTAQNHVMGKGTSPDNRDFEAIAAETGVDGRHACVSSSRRSSASRSTAANGWSRPCATAARSASPSPPPGAPRARGTYTVKVAGTSDRALQRRTFRVTVL